jgi:adenosine deaminase
MAGEYKRAALDQHLTYRQLKTIARDSLEHSFLPGDSLWTSVSPATPMAACASTATMGVGDPPSAGCQAFLAGSERATMQWELERRFRLFESQQPAK